MPRAAPSPECKRAHHCPVCQKTFTTSGHLLRHSKVHTGEKKHKCPFPGCETTCSRQDNLQQHYRIHLSQGSRRSPSTRLTSFSAARAVNRNLSTPPPSTSIPQAHIPVLDKYTVVDGPPILHPLEVIDAPSPPNTPPPLVPASPHLVLQYHLRQQASGRSGSGGDLIESQEYPLRPLSSSSSSSSSSLSPAPSLQLYNQPAVSLGSNESTPSPSYTQPIWFSDEADPYKTQTYTTSAEVHAAPMDFTGTHGPSKPSYPQNEEYFGYTSNTIALPQQIAFPFELSSHDSFRPSNFSVAASPYNSYTEETKSFPCNPPLAQMASHPYESYAGYSYPSTGAPQHMTSGADPMGNRFQSQEFPREEAFPDTAADYPRQFW